MIAVQHFTGLDRAPSSTTPQASTAAETVRLAALYTMQVAAAAPADAASRCSRGILTLFRARRWHRRRIS